MQISIKRVPIRRDMAETLLVDVGEHEIPVLQAVHGEQIKLDAIDATPDEVTIDDPRIEYERLARLYGEEPKSGRSYVDLAYTTMRQFIADLQQLAVGPKARAKEKAAA